MKKIRRTVLIPERVRTLWRVPATLCQELPHCLWPHGQPICVVAWRAVGSGRFGVVSLAESDSMRAVYQPHDPNTTFEARERGNGSGGKLLFVEPQPRPSTTPEMASGGVLVRSGDNSPRAPA